MLAFRMEDFSTGEIKNDPKYVKWMATHYDVSTGARTNTDIPMHQCTEEDYAKFHTVNAA